MGQRPQRIGITRPHQGLGGQMKNDFRPSIEKSRLKPRQIGQIGAGVRRQHRAQPDDFEQTGLGRRLERVAMNLGAQPMQPQRQPAALEASMAGDQYRAATPKCGMKAHQIFHGARPDSHRVSR